MRQSGVKGNFYAPFVGEGKWATAFSYPTITTEFGYIGGPDVVKLFAKKIIELNDQYYMREEFVRPGQMRWLVLKAG
jgi:hypothetical protein